LAALSFFCASGESPQPLTIIEEKATAAAAVSTIARVAARRGEIAFLNL
jgi:hypothetical protein